MSQPTFFDGLIETTQPPGITAPTKPAGAQSYRTGASVADQIKHVLADHSQSKGESLPKRVMQDRQDRMVKIYSELSGCGFKFDDVTSFGLRHAKTLLTKWQAQGLTKKTIYNRWTTLRSWSVTLQKFGMLGTIEDVWPEFRQTEGRQQKQKVREFTPELLQARSDFLRSNHDKTAYFVDRLTREFMMTREHALQLDLPQVLLVARGQPFVRAGNGGTAKTYQIAGTRWWELFAEAAEFMQERHREKLGWPHVEGTEAIAKYALRMSYVSRTLFSKGNKAAAGAGEQA
jgi:hypothetical protein